MVAAEKLTFSMTALATGSGNKIDRMVARVDIGPKSYQRALKEPCKAPVSVKTLGPTTVKLNIGSIKQPIRFCSPAPVDTTRLVTRVARKSSYVEVEAPAASALGWIKHPQYIFPVHPPTTLLKGQPLPLTMPRCHLASLPVMQLPAPNESVFVWFRMHTRALFGRHEDKVMSNRNSATPVLSRPRLDLKESVYSLLVNVAGVQGRGCTYMFGLGSAAGSGIEIMIVSAMRLDLGVQSVVLDAAALPLRFDILPRPAPSLRN